MKINMHSGGVLFLMFCRICRLEINMVTLQEQIEQLKEMIEQNNRRIKNEPTNKK